MILRRKTGKNRGVILLNLYSDDGLASINNEKLWREFMDDLVSDRKLSFDSSENAYPGGPVCVFCLCGKGMSPHSLMTFRNEYILLLPMYIA